MLTGTGWEEKLECILSAKVLRLGFPHHLGKGHFKDLRRGV
jgi:hypothetical protein